MGKMIDGKFILATPFMALAWCAPALAARRDDAAVAAGCGILVFWIVAAFVINILLLVWVSKDAKARGMGSMGWMILVFFTGFIGLIIYLLARTKGDKIPCPHCGNKRLAAMSTCPHCGHAENLSSSKLSDVKKCPECSENIKYEAKVCRYCGHEFSEKQIEGEKGKQRKSIFPENSAGTNWFISGLSGPLTGKNVELTTALLIIGRDPEQSNLIIPPPNQIISKQHCSIKFDNESGKILIEDLGSKNGTFLYGGQRLAAGRSYILENGDRFYLVDPDILFELQHK